MVNREIIKIGMHSGYREKIEEGVFWVLVERHEMDVDQSDCGALVGSPTGEVTKEAVLAQIFANEIGEPDEYGRFLAVPEFEVIEHDKFVSEIDETCRVLAYAPLECPAF